MLSIKGKKFNYMQITEFNQMCHNKFILKN